MCVRERERERLYFLVAVWKWLVFLSVCACDGVSGVKVIKENPVHAFGIISQGSQTAGGVAV